jgi:hypothetical protein
MSLAPAIALCALLVLSCGENCPDRSTSLVASPTTVTRDQEWIVNVTFPSGALARADAEGPYVYLYGPGGKSDERGKFVHARATGALLNVTVQPGDTLAVTGRLSSQDEAGTYTLDATAGNIGVCRGQHGTVQLLVQ